MRTRQRSKIELAPKLLDVVELLTNRPAVGLKAGAVGAVVDVLSMDAVLVEFSDKQGNTIALEAIPVDEVAVR